MCLEVCVGGVCGEDVYLVEEALETAREVFGLIIKGCLFCHLHPKPFHQCNAMQCNRLKNTIHYIQDFECSLHVNFLVCPAHIMKFASSGENYVCAMCIVQHTSCGTNLAGDTTMRDPQSDAPSPEYSDDTRDRADGYFET